MSITLWDCSNESLPCPLMQRVPTNCLEDLTPSDWMSIHNARLIPHSSFCQLPTISRAS